MPNQVEQKVIDPEAELSNAQRTFKKLAPMCSVEKRAGGEPRLAPQEKQLGILTHELKETLLCIDLAKKGQHGNHDRIVKNDTQQSIHKYEHLDLEMRDQRNQLEELDCLNYLATKKIQQLLNEVPTEADELAMIEDAAARLRRMENQLDLATKRFCVVNTDNKFMREEIHRLLVERDSFNIQWNRTIGKLVKGKEYLMDVFEIATMVFADRDQCMKKLDALKWKGVFQLNKDIAEMQSYEGDINHLAKLEEFLRIKGSRRMCEADELEEMERQEEIQRCEAELAKHDELLNDIFSYAGTSRVLSIVNNFEATEARNYQCFILLCEILQETIFLRKDLKRVTQLILDQRDINEGNDERRSKHLASMRVALEPQRVKVQRMRDLNDEAWKLLARVFNEINELMELAKCDLSVLDPLLGIYKQPSTMAVTWALMDKEACIFEKQVKSLIEVCYGAVKPPAPTPKGRKEPEAAAVKLVADPYVVEMRPNKIEKLVPYKPCAYCVEDYLMNLITETLVMPADRAYIEDIFHLEEPNTKFGIYTLTIPSKRHAYRSSQGD